MLISNGYCITCERLSASERRTTSALGCVFYLTLVGCRASIPYFFVFPLKAELLKPSDQMERHITDLIKKSLQDVTGSEFKMFMDFLKNLNIFGEKAPPKRVQELIEIIEGQADLDAQFNEKCAWAYESCHIECTWFP
ncbi:apoptosis inhibitor 5-like protein API5 [Olea europaea var. sylvestris]|uniref:apoptosis inhibitor 5-like protein API5 n=1 Tax=Olea europaea var. sylvestris TaxID=158386 RepID=UPI000C1CD073|nr:apoptosis inhibitor 5-like protein API5 [Olea europaea var. sylvestris]XP_022886102.1 apoptosis inhibitor 5-like protein API5 [Olea europaea var. sylvestris]